MTVRDDMGAAAKALVLGVLRSPEGRAALREVAAELLAGPQGGGGDVEALLSTGDVAKLLGCSRRALQERLGRALKAGEQHPLAALAIMIDNSRRWRRADVLAYVATIRGETGERR